ncbi:hypothetical protein cyc_07397 [Cyclospora cayetanensis]|uniref:Uncharacterized protein n=1 Tax=Cyclospora cayetanensis TaxID=88456 RepID=A0A1D3CSA5_9EIME|nr:hypothetical protein cyc_07397 [Cyclospora cayetanensis]
MSAGCSTSRREGTRDDCRALPMKERRGTGGQREEESVRKLLLSFLRLPASEAFPGRSQVSCRAVAGGAPEEYLGWGAPRQRISTEKKTVFRIGEEAGAHKSCFRGSFFQWAGGNNRKDGQCGTPCRTRPCLRLRLLHAGLQKPLWQHLSYAIRRAYFFKQ